MILLVAFGVYLLGLLVVIALTIYLVKKPLNSGLLCLVWTGGLWLYLFGDTIALRSEFKDLCNEKGGWQINTRADFPYDSFKDASGNFDLDSVWDFFDKEKSSAYVDPPSKSIKQHSLKFIYQDTVIAEHTSFTYWGGKYFQHFTSNATRCPETKNKYQEFYKKIFQGNIE